MMSYKSTWMVRKSTTSKQSRTSSPRCHVYNRCENSCEHGWPARLVGDRSWQMGETHPICQLLSPISQREREGTLEYGQIGNGIVGGIGRDAHCSDGDRRGRGLLRCA